MTARRFTILATLLLAGTAPAQTVLSQGHVDFEMLFSPTPTPSWEFGLHDVDNDIEYEASGPAGDPSWGLLQVNQFAIRPRPASPNFNFVGVGAGENFWQIDQNQNPLTLYLGFGAEEGTAGDLKSYTETDQRLTGQPAREWVKASLLSVSGPGTFSVWQNDIDPNSPIVWMNGTSDASTIGATDVVFAVNAAGHIDYNFGFSAPGDYFVTLEASAFLPGAGFVPTSSGPVTFQFQVVPEPSSFVLMGMAASGAFAAYRRRIARS